MINSVLGLGCLIVLAIVLEPLANKLRLPASAMWILIGFIGAELLTKVFDLDTGLRWQDFHDLTLHVLVPILVYQSALNLKWEDLKPELVSVLAFATIGLVLAAMIAGVLLYWGLGYPSYYTIMAGILTAVIFSATDPAAVINIMQKLHVPKSIQVQLEGESLFNDATAVVGFTMLVSVLVIPAQPLTVFDALFELSWVLIGSTILAVVIGGLALVAIKIFQAAIYQQAFSVAAVLFATVLAEDVVMVSPIVTVLVVGLIMGAAQRQYAEQAKAVFSLWAFLAWLGQALLFILLGMTITVGMFESHWLTMLLAIAAALIARASVVYLLPVVLTVSRLHRPTSWFERHILFWGGMRGAVSIALVLSLPTTIETWYIIQAAVYGVVLFSVFVQAVTMQPLLIWATAKDKL